ncbi:hypothetical protein QBC43DRAFT_330274 [Cladorrhinum sp. PSN259]|nr:hypothetical protein QBC43DRAFT_330274 [Cladorrhinum sp. PSN259]
MVGFGEIFRKTFGSLGPRAVNTLDADPSAARPAAQRRPAPSNTHTDPPPPKRQRLMSSMSLSEQNLRSATEEIEDFDREGTAPVRRRESATSLTISHSPILTSRMYESFSMPGHNRSHRRRRKSRGNKDDIQDEEMDEIAHNPKPMAPNHRKAVLEYQNDSADVPILQGINKSRGKKRLGGADTGYDELSYEPPGNSSVNRSANVARKAKVTSNQGPVPGFEVKAAVCQKTWRYIAGSGCLLTPKVMATKMELRAFTKDGEQAEPFQWLKITEKVKTLSYSPDSPYIKITQATDENCGIGALMVVKFAASSTANRVKEWVQRSMPSVGLVEEESNKLATIYDRLNDGINRALQSAQGQASSRPPSRQQPEISPRNREFPGSAILASSPLQASPNSRVPLRSQMQVSEERPQPTEAQSPVPTRRPPQPSVQLPIHGQTRDRPDRSLRSTQCNSGLDIISPRASIDVEKLPAPQRWTEEHPEWEEQWATPLVYKRTTVDKDDIPRLDEGQFLNDNLISFGLRYLFDEFANRDQNINKRAYFHNSFFYTKLKGPRGTINYDSVKNWTAKVDLLSYDYIVVPVNENFHWWVAIICNPGRLDPDLAQPTESSAAEMADASGNRTNIPEPSNNADSSDVKMTGMDDEGNLQAMGKTTINNSSYLSIDNAAGQSLVRSDIVDLITDDKDAGAALSPTIKTKQRRKSSIVPSRRPKLGDPRIITLDSLNQGHSPAVTVLKKYLIAEFEHKRNKTITDVPSPFGMKATNIPTQDNFCDCGIYLLAYIQEFVRRPDEFIQAILSKEAMDWNFDPSKFRVYWRDTILCQQKIPLDSKSLSDKKSRESSTATGNPSQTFGPSNDQSRASSELGDKSRANSSMGGAAIAVEASSRTPAEVYELTDSEPETSKQKPKPAQKRISFSPANHTPSAPCRFPIHDHDEVELLKTSTLEEDRIRPSIEKPDVAITPKLPKVRSDDPRFLQKAPDSPPTLQEVRSKYFYGQQETSSGTTKKRSKSKSSVAVASSSPNGLLPTPKTSQAFHTESRFVVSDVPAVNDVELVRQDDPIEIDSD